MCHILSFICIQRHFPLVEHIYEDQESFWTILLLMRQTGNMDHFWVYSDFYVFFLVSNHFNFFFCFFCFPQ